jgi:uncharacterized membrane protein
LILRISRWLLAAGFVAAGVNHFVSPAAYVAIVPPQLPRPEALVAISGVAEIAGGLGILWQPTRRIAAAGLIALLVAVFPANIYAAVTGMEIGDRAVPQWLLWVRLPLQPLFIAWVYVACCRGKKINPDLS